MQRQPSKLLLFFINNNIFSIQSKVAVFRSNVQCIEQFFHPGSSLQRPFQIFLYRSGFSSFGRHISFREQEAHALLYFTFGVYRLS